MDFNGFYNPIEIVITQECVSTIVLLTLTHGALNPYCLRSDCLWSVCARHGSLLWYVVLEVEI